MANLPFVFFLLNLRPLKKVVSGQSQETGDRRQEAGETGHQ
jgi:hypothetical protein